MSAKPADLVVVHPLEDDDDQSGIVAALFDLHRTGLERLLALLSDGAAEQRLDLALATDDLLSRLLLLHHLHPWPLGVRVDRAIAAVNRSAGSQALATRVIEASRERVLVQAMGDRDLIRWLERALAQAAPDAERIEVQEVEPRRPARSDVASTAPRSSAVTLSRCDLCGQELPGGRHTVLFDRLWRSLDCACRTCAALLGGSRDRHYLRVPRRVERLDSFAIDDDTWNALGVPIGLAYFARRAGSGEVFACYPGPAGGVEAGVDALAWSELVAANPDLADLEPEVEALMVDRRPGAPPRCYRLSIDECYRLVGVVHAACHGYREGGSAEAAIEGFFAGLADEPEA